ncbi:MAG: hypothetical protein HQM09_09910 [Candidatus Riflebacteria bacterium]|nr:hypothetical protein [Candidatus Riflebacteria bacterium]
MSMQLRNNKFILLAGIIFLGLFISVAPVYSATMKEWTFAVFLNADNNLDPRGVEDQIEMSRVGSNDWLNMVTLIDRANGPASLNYIEKNKVTLLKDLGEIDMGDYKQLISFMQFVVANYPAKRYILTIWNHGSGWRNQAGKHIYRGISYDETSGNHITTAQLEAALKEIRQIIGHNIDILNMDACLMQMVEVAYACKDSTDYIVASEEVVPGKGNPYDDVFAALTATDTTENFSKNWVNIFTASFSNGSQGQETCTQSCIKCSEIGQLVDAINGFAKATMSTNFRKEYHDAILRVQKFASPENIDLIHFVQLIQASVKEVGIQNACTKLLEASKKFILQNSTNGSSVKNANGLAIYLPFDFTLESAYKELSFAQATVWGDMISDLYHKATSASLIDGINSGDLRPLQAFVADSRQASPEMIQFVLHELNYRLYTEGGLPKEIESGVSSLSKKLLITIEDINKK